MSASLQAINSKPLAYFDLDTAAPFTDLSGYNRSGGMSTGTAGKSVSLGNGFDYSTVFSNTAIGVFVSPVFLMNKEAQAFSLEAVVKPLSGTTTQQVLSHLNTYDGLVITGTKVAFVTLYATTGEARAEYDLQVSRRVHLVGVHTYRKNLLFVDGELVASVDITQEQQADKFATSNGNLYTGNSTAAASIAVNGIGIYASALTASEIIQTYIETSSVSLSDSVPLGLDATVITPSYLDADTFMIQVFDTDEDWNTGKLTNMSVVDVIKPLQINGTSQAASWVGAVDLDLAAATSIAGINVSWQGTGVIVEWSLDATSWTAVTKWVDLSLPNNFNPTNKNLYIRVRFPGGILNDPAYLSSLTVYGYSTKNLRAITDRTVTISAGYYKDTAEPYLLRDDWGVEVRGSMTIGASTETSPNPMTLELWMKRLDSTSFSTTFSGSARVNGAVSATVPVGEWALYHVVAVTPQTGTITITGNVQIGQIIIYETALTNAQVKNVYNSYTGGIIQRLDDNGTISVPITGQSANLYAHNWAITAAG